ncbi:MAG: glycosyltransferase [Thermoleophilaceae bacterium]
MATKRTEVVRVIAMLEPGGAQLSALRLTLALKEHGISTRMLAGHATPEGLAIYERAGVDVDTFRAPVSLQYECDEGFARWLEPRVRRADLVHAHMFGAWWAAARAVPAGVPLVASEHNAVRWPGEPALDQMRRALERVDLFFAHGPKPDQLMRSLGLPVARLRCGISAIGPAAPAPAPELPAPRVVYTGRLHHEKGPDLLLEALALLESPPHAVLVGSGPMTTELRGRAGRLGLRGRVTFAGWQDDPSPIIRGASAVVVPSRHDSWSQTAVLAMASRTPVIVTDADGLPEVVAGRRGVTVAAESPVALAEAIEQVVGGRLVPDLDAAQAYASRFRAPRVAAGYAGEYARLMARAPSPELLAAA